MFNSHVSRRKMLRILKGSAAVLTCAAIAPSILSGCQKKSTTDHKENLENLPIDCPDTDNLGQEVLAQRKLLNYVDTSSIPTRTCSNCKLYTNPSSSSHCGGCQVLPGPVHPRGYCSSWYYRM